MLTLTPSHRSVTLLLALAACAPVNTLPRHLAPDDPVQRYELEIPSWLDVRAVDFSATTFSDVSGTGSWTSTQVGGRAFVKVYGVHRETGEQYLLLYESPAKRRGPTQVIRFRSTSRDDSLPDP